MWCRKVTLLLLLPLLLWLAPLQGTAQQSITTAWPQNISDWKTVEAADSLRLKAWNSAGTGEDLKFKLVIKFRRRADPRLEHTVTKIVSLDNDRAMLGAASATGGSYPFGAAAGKQNSGHPASITDADSPGVSNTLTSATAAFTAADVGKTITISGAGTACSGDPCQGPQFPTTLYQGAIVGFTNGTTVTVKPQIQVDPGGTGTLKIEPILLADDDGLELGDGWLTGVDVNFWQVGQRVGQTYVEGEINRGPWNMHQGVSLFSDYLETSFHVSWPQVNKRHKIDGRGWTRTFLQSVAAGSDVLITVPTNAHWVLKTFRAQLTTSVTAPVRQVFLLIDDGTNLIYDQPFSATQAASLTYAYEAAATGTARDQITAATLVRNYVPLYPDLHMMAGWRIRTSTAALATGAPQDAWTLVVITVEEWIEEAGG